LESTQSHSPWPVHSLQETSPNFLRRPTPVDNTADNSDITQSQPASHRLLSHVTLGVVECREQTACAQTAISASSRIPYFGHSTQYSHLVVYIEIRSMMQSTLILENPNFFTR